MKLCKSRSAGSDPVILFILLPAIVVLMTASCGGGGSTSSLVLTGQTLGSVLVIQHFKKL